MNSHDPEAELAALLARHAQTQPWEHRHPLVVLRAAALLRAITPRTYQPSDTRDAEIISNRLRRSHFGLNTVLHQAVSVLELPERPGGYGSGHSFKSQRKHARKALRAGVSWTQLTQESEKSHFLELAHANQQASPRAESAPPDVDFTGLLDSEFWMAAWLGERPLLLTVAAVDGEWSMLRYFCRLESRKVASSTRYLMTGVLAEELAARGVRFACDSVSPFRLHSGLREFSRMVGFRIHRVRVE